MIFVKRFLKRIYEIDTIFKNNFSKLSVYDIDTIFGVLYNHSFFFYGD